MEQAQDDKAISEVSRRGMEIFSPQSTRHRAASQDSGSHFVHYTSAANALNILTTRELWLRDTRCMNDWMEIEHGKQLLFSWFHQNRHRLEGALDKCCPGTVAEAAKIFDDSFNYHRRNTFVACVSEELPIETKGRLSMLRAYGSIDGPGVAVFLAKEPFYAEIDVGIYSTPVWYPTKEEFDAGMEGVLEAIENNAEFLKSLPPNAPAGFLYSAFLQICVATKNAGFKEEREWRIIFTNVRPSPVVDTRVVSIRGVPQVVNCVQLIERPDLGFENVSIAKVVKKIVIGPSEFGSSIYDAFLRVLTEAGMEEPQQKLEFADIPLRC